MASVFDVAKYILAKMGKLSTWKLQKLCYYAQAWSLAWDNKALFDEDFQAWMNGPVCPELFNVHRGQYEVSADTFPCGDSKNLMSDQKENIDIVLDHYGDKEAYWLREQSHSEDPWKEARVGVPDGERSQNIITKEAMGNYYGSL